MPFQLDKEVLKPLVEQVNALAARPDNALKAQRWKYCNALGPQNRRERPPVIVCATFGPEFDGGRFRPALVCENEDLRKLEERLRTTLLRSRVVPDDAVYAPAAWHVPRAVRGWGCYGLSSRHEGATPGSGGAFHIQPVILEPRDLDKIQPEDLRWDRAQDEREFARWRDLVGDLLPVKFSPPTPVIMPINDYNFLRGPENLLMDLAADPEFAHEGIRRVAAGIEKWCRQLEELNLLELNNQGPYATDDLPAPGFDPQHVRLRDLFVFTEAQEFTSVSPEMHLEFAIRYERPIAELFGLVSYGCCEDLTNKIEQVATIRNLRQIGVTPWADPVKCAERIGERYSISWRPSPAVLASPLREAELRRSFREALSAFRANGCALSVMLKDLHTCGGDPARLTRWTEILNEEIEKVWD